MPSFIIPTIFVLVLAFTSFQGIQLLNSPDMMSKIPGFAAYLAAVACLSIPVYRATCHPLAKYPGPWWAAITDWYSVYHIYRGDRHLDFYQLHEKYGKIVRFGPRRISIQSVEALRDVYSVTANVKRSQVYASTAHFFGGTPSSNTTSDMKEHAFRRRVNIKAMSPANIKSMEELILKNIRYFCDHISAEQKGQWSAPQDMSKVVGYLVSDIMGDITFSKNWEVQTKPDNRDLLVSLPEGVAGIHLVGYMPELIKLKLDKLLFRTLIAGVNRFTSLSVSIFQWRFAQKNCNDLFSALLQAKDPESGQQFSTDQLVSEAGLLTVAGSDTASTATTATFFYITHYPEALRRLTTEIRQSFTNVEDICIGPLLSSCKYLAACIKESLRLTPPVGSTLMREVLPGGLTVEGEWFPAGTDIGVPHYALHHDETYFRDAFRFAPERWLSTESYSASIPPEKEDEGKDSGPATNSTGANDAAFAAFGVGRTSCIGKYLAYQEISLIIARTLWLYDVRKEPGSRLGEGSVNQGPGRKRKNEFQTLDRFVSMHDGPMVQFRHREN